MKPRRKVVILGGGLSAMAAAYSLARTGLDDVTIVESEESLGGLAGSFARDGNFYPLGYHHILHRDRCLLYFLDLIGALPRVRWRKIRMLFELPGKLYNLANPWDFLRFPMSLADKLRFVRLMLRAFCKRDWSEWEGRSGRELLDSWAGPGVTAALFDPLLQLKFGRRADGVSAAWVGMRISYREGSAPLGYIPDANWTTVLCDGLARMVEEAGCRIRLRARVSDLVINGDRIVAAKIADGTELSGDLFVSTVPSEVYLRLLPDDATPHLRRIRYTALLSAVCATRQEIRPDFYWTNLSSLEHTACAVFLLSSLNPTIGEPGESCINFITHLPRRDSPLFTSTDDELMAAYGADFRSIFGGELEPSWVHVARIPNYSPIFDVEYRKPPVRSVTYRNVYFAGAYRAFPSVASTGCALWTGVEAAHTVLHDQGTQSHLPEAASGFRLKEMPHA